MATSSQDFVAPKSCHCWLNLIDRPGSLHRSKRPSILTCPLRSRLRSASKESGKFGKFLLKALRIRLATSKNPKINLQGNWNKYAIVYFRVSCQITASQSIRFINSTINTRVSICQFVNLPVAELQTRHSHHCSNSLTTNIVGRTKAAWPCYSVYCCVYYWRMMSAAD